MRNSADLPRAPLTSRRLRIGVLIAVVVLIVLAVSLTGLARFWTDYLWFQSVGFTSVFRGVLVTRLVLAVLFIAIFFLMMFGNLLIADRAGASGWEGDTGEDELVNRYRDVVRPHARVVRIVTAAVFALLAGSGANREWNNWDLFRYHVSFGVSDPQFHMDVGFYVFQLPFIEFLLSWTFEALIIVLLVTAVSHYLNGGICVHGSQRGLSPAVKIHLSVLLGVLAIVKGVDYWFQRYELVLSRTHVVNGATATSVHADLPALTLLVAIAVIAAGLFLFNIRQKGWLLPAVGVALWGVVYLLVGVAYPALYQAIRVNPSELTRESAYIQRNINATRAAYGLNDVKVESTYQYSPTISTAEVQGPSTEAAATRQTLSNVRLLDPTNVNLQNTFDKYQSIRYYYSFSTLELDRYAMDAPNGATEEVPTVTAVRELNSLVPSGFVNHHLEYTHGYGAVVVPTDESGVNQNGTPNFTLQDIPPDGAPQLSDQGAQAYYGEGPDLGGYVIADSKTAELDYENSSDQEVTSKYQGSGGVKAGGFFSRLAFAIRFGDPNFVLSGQINSSSRVMYIRNVTARAEKAAPFLKYDSDPYPVILNNNLYWVLDAYTTTDNYPYSQNANTDGVPSNSGLDSTFNYVRNSVKVVVNAYNGDMDFFVVDQSDPIIRVYEKAFPDLFKPGSEANTLIPGITAHFRYPEDVFKVQSNMYGRYHLTDANDFFTQAQSWTVSPDPGSGPLSSTELDQYVGTTAASGSQQPQVAQIQPQYLLASLPGSTKQTFMLVTPYVPSSSSSENLTAYLTVAGDPWDYGQLELFEMPPNQTVLGPGLVANAIKSNPQISYQLTYLNQQGSTVELGEVAVVPIGQTLLYVQPIYVESSTDAVPTLKDVVVVYDGTAYQSSNASLDRALCQIRNPDGSQPFSSYCNTVEADYPTFSSPTAGGTSTSPTTSPPTTPTTAPPSSGSLPAAPSPPPGSTVSSLLSQAQSSYQSAQAALTAGNLAAYQADNSQAVVYVEEAEQLAKQKGS